MLSQPDSCPIIYSGGNFQLDFLLLTSRSLAPTDRADFFGYLAFACTRRTYRSLLDVTKYSPCRRHDLATTLAGLASFQLVTGLGSSSLAMFTDIIERQTDGFLRAENSFLKGNCYLSLYITTS